MSDKMRWRYGDTNPVVAAVDKDTAIEIGDLLWLDGHDAKPASMLAGYPYEFAKGVFVSQFLGVAMQRSRDGDVEPIRVATTGVFEFGCLSDIFELGDFVAPCPSDGCGILSNQDVAKVAERYQAIGRVPRREPTPSTCVLVDIRSKVMCGGVLC